MNDAVIEVFKQENDIKHQTTIPLRNNDCSYILVLLDDSNSCLVSANSETQLNYACAKACWENSQTAITPIR